jgi:hypothetical protein
MPRPKNNKKAHGAAAGRLLENNCAWCLKRILARDPVIGVHVTLPGADFSDSAGRMVAMTIGGRLVAGCVPVPGSLVALEGCHIGFLVCCKACAAALRAAIAAHDTVSSSTEIDPQAPPRQRPG